MQGLKTNFCLKIGEKGWVIELASPVWVTVSVIRAESSSGERKLCEELEWQFEGWHL